MANTINPRMATSIINDYKEGRKTLEEANKELAEIGAGFSLNPEKGTGVWTEEEMKEGFRGTEEPGEVLLEKPDMKRRPELAGMVVRQKTKMGQFDVHYNENGYAVKAVRAK